MGTAVAQRLMGRSRTHQAIDRHGLRNFPFLVEIREIIEMYDQELGPWRGQPYRLITRDVMKRVHERLKQVDWSVLDPDETEKKGKPESK